MTDFHLPPEWVSQAVCATVDPAIWFPEKGGNNGVAKAICRSCPVQVECLEYALAQEVPPEGIWGGLSSTERRRLRRQRGITSQLQPCGTRAAYYRHLTNGKAPCEDCRDANREYHAIREGRATSQHRVAS